MVLTADQQNLRDFLRETIPLLCKSRLDFQSKFTVEAVIGLTIDDDDLFFVSLNENVSASAELHSKQAADDLMTQSMLPASTAQGSEEYHPKRKRKKVAQRKETPPIPSLTMSVDEGDIATNLESSEVGLGYIKTEVVDQHHESGLDESGLGAMPGMSSTLMDDSDDDDGGADDGDDYAVDDRSDDDDYKPTPTTATESEARTDDTNDLPRMELTESVLSREGNQDRAPQAYQYETNQIAFQQFIEQSIKSIPGQLSHLESPKKNDYVCELCGKSFKARASLYEHRRRIHLKKPRYSCPHCPKGFMDKCNYDSHVNSHNNIKEYQCNTCQKEFGYKQSYKVHIQSCQGGLRYPCEYCGVVMTRKDTLRGHIQALHKQDSDQKPYKCVCGKSFKWRQVLSRHIKKCPATFS